MNFAGYPLTSTLHLRPLANGLVHVSVAPPVASKPVAQSECPLAGTLRETSATSCHELLPLQHHRDLKISFLQWVGNGDVKSGRRNSSMVMMNSDVTRLDIGALNLILLSHNESSR